MNFDPMTGKPIQGGNDTGMGFDPMTGIPIQGGNDTEMGFDPMTGQPIQGGNNTGMGFDPMTGQPIQGGNNAGMGFDPMTGMPIKKRSLKPLRYIAVGVAGVAVVGTVAFAGIKSGIFLGKGNKVLLAVANTVTEQGQFSEKLSDAGKVVSSGKYTMTVKGEIEGVNAELTYTQASKDKQIKGAVGSGGMNISFDAVLDKEKLSVDIPLLSDDILVYNYKEKKDGFLVDELGEEIVDTFDSSLKTLYSPETSKEDIRFVKDLMKAFTDEYKELEYKKVDKEKYEVDGKDRNCKGYQTTITADNFLNVCENVETVLETYYEEHYKDMLNGLEFEEGLDSMMSEFRDMFDEFPDMDITFYIYKNKLACINVDVDGEEVELMFLGGDTRMQNIVLEADGDEILEIKGENSDKEESSTIYFEGEEFCEVTYDYDNGDYEIASPVFNINGAFETDRNGAVLTLDEMEGISGFAGIEGEVSIQKGGKIEELDGDTFDIGNASESDFEDLLEGVAGAGLGSSLF